MASGTRAYPGLDMVLYCGDCAFRDYGSKGGFKMARALTDFAKGIIAGAVGSAIIFGVIIAFHFLNKRDKELIEYAERQRGSTAI